MILGRSKMSLCCQKPLLQTLFLNMSVRYFNLLLLQVCSCLCVTSPHSAFFAQIKWELWKMSSSSGLALAQKMFPTLTVALLLAATSLSAAHFKPSPVVSHIPREIPALMALLIGLFFFTVCLILFYCKYFVLSSSHPEPKRVAGICLIRCPSSSSLASCKMRIGINGKSVSNGSCQRK